MKAVFAAGVALYVLHGVCGVYGPHGFSTLAAASAGRHASTAAAQGETGAIRGRVTLAKGVRGNPLPSNVYPRRSVGHQDKSRASEIRNVVVYLKGATAAGALPVRRHEIRQEHERFAPRVLPITRGSRVEFPNADPFFHNVFSLSSAANFDLGRYPPGTSRGHTFTRTGLVKVFCHIHSHMSATVLVLDHPYFAVPDADGAYTIPDVPAGSYSLVGWHERVGEHTAPVEIRAGSDASVDLTLPMEDGA